MTYVRSKTVKGHTYYYLVEGVREGNKTYQKVIAYLGVHETVEAARDYWLKLAKTAPDAADRKRARAMANKLEPYL
jgi:hypothetical protein